MSPDPQPAGPTPEQLEAAAQAEARMAALLAMGDVNQANAATGIYGDSGTGKSTLAATGAEYGWQRYHRTTRYYSADPGGFGNKLIRLIRLGIAQVYNPTNHIEPFETMENISKGWWPEVILDPFTGYAAPDVKLIPPERTEFVVFCSKGHEVVRTSTKKTLNGFSRQCPVCKGAPVTPQTWQKVEEQIIRAPGCEHVGLYVYDSGTALCDHAMEDMAGRAAANDPNIKDGNALSGTGARIISGAYAFGANTQQHYGFAQNRIRQWIKNTRLIPGQVMPPIWTFLVQRGSDDNSNMSVFGPKISGNAKTAEVPAWLGNCLHAEIVVNEKQQRKHRLWLVNHMMPGTNVPYLAKTRTEPGDLPQYLEDQDNEPIFTRFSLGYLFDQQEQALNKHAAQDILDFPDAPTFVPLSTGEAKVVAIKDLSDTSLAGGVSVGRAAVTARPAAVAPPSAARPAAVPTPAATAPAVVGGAKPAPTAAVPTTPSTGARPVSAPAPATAPAAAPATTPRAPVAATKPATVPAPAVTSAPKPATPAAVAAPAQNKPATAVPPTAAPPAPAAAPPVAAVTHPAGRPPTPPAVNPQARRGAPPPPGRPAGGSSGTGS